MLYIYPCAIPDSQISTKRKPVKLNPLCLQPGTCACSTGPMLPRFVWVNYSPLSLNMIIVNPCGILHHGWFNIGCLPIWIRYLRNQLIVTPSTLGFDWKDWPRFEARTLSISTSKTSSFASPRFSCTNRLTTFTSLAIPLKQPNEEHDQLIPNGIDTISKWPYHALSG